MLLPDEIVASRVLPTLRAMIARELAGAGLSERAVADRLGLTQSAVSKYLRGRIRLEAAVEGLPAFKALAGAVAKGLADESLSRVAALGEIMAAVRRQEDRGLVCQLHEAAVPELAGLGCDLCVRAGASDLVADQEVLGDLRVALRTIESSPGFRELIPNVGCNLARGRAGARTPLDVAAVPGRIFEMRGAIRVPAAPEFGASRHVAEVVLAVMRFHPPLRAALNVRAGDEVLQAAKSEGWGLVRFASAYEGRSDRIAGALKGRDRDPDGLYHGGGFGVEPILYIVGRSAQEVVAKALRLLEQLERHARRS